MLHATASTIVDYYLTPRNTMAISLTRGPGKLRLFDPSLLLALLLLLYPYVRIQEVDWKRKLRLIATAKDCPGPSTLYQALGRQTCWPRFSYATLKAPLQTVLEVEPPLPYCSLLAYLVVLVLLILQHRVDGLFDNVADVIGHKNSLHNRTQLVG